MSTYNFFATISRMKYIERWALMRASRAEDLSEHSLEVAMIAHALCTIGNVRYGKSLDADRAAVCGLFHDATEIITGDMPTPVKYYNKEILSAYKDVEKTAKERLLSGLPEDLRPSYEKVFADEAAGSKEGAADDPEAYMLRLVKAADKLSALIKCIEEESAGNTEFRNAAQSTKRSLAEMKKDIPALNDFMEEFLPSYGRTLDELLGRAI